MGLGRTVLGDDAPGDARQRPRFLTQGAIRLGILCAFIALVEMASPRMTPSEAGLVALAGSVLVVAGLGGFVLYGHRLAERLGSNAAATLGVLRHTGLPLLGLAFFLVWTIAYIGLWWFRPGGAFTGLEPAPRFADFFYYAVSTGLISPPGDIVATSRGVRAATLIEMVCALALVTAYLSSFTDFLDRRRG